jgi:hypothetical protein
MSRRRLDGDLLLLLFSRPLAAAFYTNSLSAIVANKVLVMMHDECKPHTVKYGLRIPFSFVWQLTDD